MRFTRAASAWSGFLALMFLAVLVGAWALPTPAAAQTTLVATVGPGTPAGFEIDGELFSGNGVSYLLPSDGDDWAAGTSFTGVLLNDGSPNPIRLPALFARDGNVGNMSAVPELSTFASSNKNGDNISAGADPYQYITGGSTPPKDDLTEVYAHSRIDVNGDLWLILAATDRSTNGDSHLDFEYNQAGINQTSNQLIGLGPNGGRTVGDFIISFNYTNGGRAPEVEVFRWDQTSPGVYGFVDITSTLLSDPLNPGIFGAENTGLLGGPGQFCSVPWLATGSDGSLVSCYAQFQFAETAINLTLAGFGSQQLCSGAATLDVKSRASQSITSELHDFLLNTFSIINPPVTTAANDGPACEGGTIHLTATDVPGGTFAWTGPNGFQSTEQNPTLTNVTSANAGVYSVVATSGDGCPSNPSETTVVVNPPATANAGPDQTVCASSPTVTLAASFGGGASSGSWIGGLGTFSPDRNSPTAMYTPAASEIPASGSSTATMVNLTWQTNDPVGPCLAASDAMIITINPAAVANAGPDQTVCVSSPAVTLSASSSGGASSGSWIGGLGSFNPDRNTANAIYTPAAGELPASGSSTATMVTLTWQTNDPTGPCPAVSDDMKITINPAAVANAGPDQTVCATSPTVTLAASSSGGASSGSWAGGLGTFNPDRNSPTAMYTPAASELPSGSSSTQVSLTWNTNDPTGPCGPASDGMVININPAATANAGPDQTVCATSPTVTLAASFGGGASSGSWAGGLGTFNPDRNSPTAMYTPAASELPSGSSSTQVSLTWNTNDPTGPCGPASDGMVITINPAATANAGPDQTVCATSPTVTLAASFGGGASSGSWIGGLGTFNPNRDTPNATYTPAASELPSGSSSTQVSLTWQTNDPVGPCGPASDGMVININPGATANAGPDQTVCVTSPSVTLAASFGGGATSGSWAGGLGTFNPDRNSPTATYTPAASELPASGSSSSTQVSLTWNTNDPAGPCGPASDGMVITINPQAIANAGPDQTVCVTSPSVTLSAQSSGGASSGSWAGGLGTFNPDRNSPTATYTPAASELPASGSSSSTMVTLTWNTNDPSGPCGPASDDMKITINPAAVANAGPDASVCSASPSVMLSASSSGGASSGSWLGGLGTFNPDRNSPTATYTPAASELPPSGSMTSTMVTLTWQTNDPTGPCGPVSDDMKITINPIATANAGPDQTVCASSPTVTLAASSGGGASTGSWLGGLGTFNPDRNSPTATYTPAASELPASGSSSSTMVTLTWKTNDPTGECGTAQDDMKITYNPIAIANAGPDQTVCASSPAVTLAASSSGGASSGSWLGGLGTFNPDRNSPTAVYTPAASELPSGSSATTVSLTWQTNDPTGPCGPVTDGMVITINPIATANAGPDQTVCADNAKVTLAASQGGGASSGSWLGGLGTFAPDRNSPTAMYTPAASELPSGSTPTQVNLTWQTNDPTGPCGPASDGMVITINPIATANAGADQTVCADNAKVTLNASSGGGASSGSWLGGLGTFAPDRNTPNAMYTPAASELPSGSTSSTVNLTWQTNDPVGPCGPASDGMVITINPIATANAGADQLVCADNAKVTLNASSGGGASSGSWLGGLGTFDPNRNAPNAMYTPAASELPSGSSSTQVSLTWQTSDPTGPCGPASDGMVITIDPIATVDAGADATAHCPDHTVVLMGSVGGSATTGCWTGGSGTFIPDNCTLHATYILSAGEIAAGGVTLTLTTNDPVGPCGPVSDAVVIAAEACATDTFCTLTQGAYGTEGGKSFGYGTLELIQLLITPSSPLVVGVPGRSITIPDGSEQCIIDRLPGNSTASALPTFGDQTVTVATGCNTNPAIPTQKNSGSWRNVFLGQLITLSLNVRLDDYGAVSNDLGSFDLKNQCMVSVPQNVLDELMARGNTTVLGFLQLANDAIGGASTGLAMFSDIAAVTGSINEAFDECKPVVPCDVSDLDLTSKTSRTQTTSISTGIDEDEVPGIESAPATFALFAPTPNPAYAGTAINFALPEQSKVRVSILNVLGQEVAVLADGNMAAGFKVVTWGGADTHAGVYFVRMEAVGLETSRTFRHTNRLIVAR